MIEEGSIIKIIDKNNVTRAMIDKIVVQEDITIDDDGKDYTFLLRHKECNENCIFESYKIYKIDDGYAVEGYFKDAILDIPNKCVNEIHESC